MRLIYNTVEVAFSLYYFLIIARCLLSWLPFGLNNSIVRFVYEMTEPVMAPFRRLLGNSFLGIDFSPVLAIFFLQFVEYLVLNILLSLF